VATEAATGAAEWLQPRVSLMLADTVPLLAEQSAAPCRTFLRRAGWATIVVLLAMTGAAAPVGAQVETFMLKRGSNIGPETKVTPTNCVAGSDGSVRCDTQIVNPPSSTPAKPQFQPFKN